MFGVVKNKIMYGKKVKGIERSTFLIGPDGLLLQEWRGLKVPGHVDEVLKAVKSIKALKSCLIGTCIGNTFTECWRAQRSVTRDGHNGLMPLHLATTHSSLKAALASRRLLFSEHFCLRPSHTMPLPPPLAAAPPVSPEAYENKVNPARQALAAPVAAEPEEVNETIAPEAPTAAAPMRRRTRNTAEAATKAAAPAVATPKSTTSTRQAAAKKTISNTPVTASNGSQGKSLPRSKKRKAQPSCLCSTPTSFCTIPPACSALKSTTSSCR